jgi:serine phosphatase RsbU (regulator of sigma subunit)
MNKHLDADNILSYALSIHKSFDKLHYEILLSQIDVKIEQNKLNAAKSLIDTCSVYFKRTSNLTALSMLKLKTAKIESIKQNFIVALNLAVEAYHELQGLNYRSYILDAARAVTNYSSQLGDYKKAYTFSQIYHDIRDSLSNENNRWALNMMQAELVLTEKENKIKVLEKEKVIEKEKLRYQQLFTIGALVALIIVAFLLFFAVKNFRLSKKQNNIISLQKDKLETQVKLVNNKNIEILSSINYASRLQSAIVNPHQFFTNIFPNSFIFYQPKDIVAGDFFWCEKIENKVFFAAADCTGHGVPGALVSVVCATALNRTLYEYEKHEPGEILDTTRQLIIETFSKSKSGVMDGMDISFCVLDTDAKQVTWAGANNPLWIYKSASQQLLEYKPNKQPIGNWENATPFTSHVIQLESMDVLYLFTDGFQDQFGTDDILKPIKKFKPAGMRKMLQSIATLAAEEQYQRVQHTFETWKGDTDQIDDVTLIGICIS